MSGVYVWILLFLVVALVALLVVWFYARRVKRDLDDVAERGRRRQGVLELAPASVARLRELSAEPILLKQSEEGVRVQIEHRPMLPLMAFVGKDVSTALTEAAVRVSRAVGPRWVVLLTLGRGRQRLAQRLA